MAGGSRSAAKIARAQRAQRLVSLRTQGLPYRAIAETWEKETGQKISKSTVQNDIVSELKKLTEQTTAEMEYYRALELTRLNLAMSAICLKVSQGHVGAVAQWVKISESRRKLLGLDAPIQIQVQKAVESELNALLDFLKNNISSEAYSEFMDAASLFQERSSVAATN